MYFMFSKLLYGFLKNHCLINYHLREISFTALNWSRGRRKPNIRWRFLEHQGPLFPPLYESLPVYVKFRYEDNEIELSKNSEEIATFYAKFLNHEYAQKKLFCRNFFEDWRAQMTTEERQLIKDFKKCDFTHIHRYLVEQKEGKKVLSKKEKQELKELNQKILKKYAFCRIDRRLEKIVNFKIQPPGLFRGRGEHPKMGKLRKRIEAEDVTINCSADSKFPKPPKGHKWKEIKHDNKVEWLACWTCSLTSKIQYTRLSGASKLQITNDLRKFQLARELSKCIATIRKEYYSDLTSNDSRIRQRAVALYFIDKLALRAGNEKGEDQADTVGCCTLRVEHIQLYKEKDGQKNVVVFDFLGKDAIRYYNEVSVDELVFINLQSFHQNKRSSDKLFDKLSTQFLNRYLKKLMPGLSAKVFRTYNASITLQNQLEMLTDKNAHVSEKVLQYKRANRAVAILCNHQRTTPKSYEKSIENLNSKLCSRKQKMNDIRKLLESSKNIEATKKKLDKMERKIKKLEEEIMKLNFKKIEKEENKTIAMDTSKINYLDPRISVSWCKKHGVPIEEIYNKTQLSKFQWAIEKTSSNFKF